MKKETQESYQEWIGGLEAKLASKPDRLAQFKELVADEDFKTYASSSVMAEKEFYRRLNDTNAKEKELDSLAQANARKEAALVEDALKLRNWFDTVEPQAKAAMDEARAYRSRAARAEAQLVELGLEVDSMANPKPEGDSNVAADNPLWAEVQKLRADYTQLNQSVPVAFTQLLTVAERARKEGYDFDPTQLMQTAANKNVDLSTAYEIVTSEPRTAKFAKEIEERVANARKEGEREALSRLSSPDRLAQRGAPVSDHFSPGEGAKALHEPQARVDKAMNEFLKLDPSLFSGF